MQRTTILLALLTLTTTALRAAEPPAYRIQLDTISKGYDGKTCWVHPRAGLIPGNPFSVVLTTQKLLLTGSDVFYALNEFRSDDAGKTWKGPVAHEKSLGRHNEEGGVIVGICDFWPKWHAASGKLLGIGHEVRYNNDKGPMKDTKLAPVYSVYDPQQQTWTAWQPLKMPEGSDFVRSSSGSVQRVDLPDGTILLPCHHRSTDQPFARVCVLKCKFDGQQLTVVDHGNDLSVDSKRGLAEPSIARYKNRYYLTVRHDNAGYITSSDDGLTYPPLKPWLWEDGTELGSYNTQTHWVTNADALFLVYTRRGADNDHIFRHRAPLFIAQVNPETLRVIRETEKVLIPQRGARLCNFGIVDVSPTETWVTVAEWMQTIGPNHIIPVDNKYGSDNSIFAARIIWEKPNAAWDQH